MTTTLGRRSTVALLVSLTVASTATGCSLVGGGRSSEFCDQLEKVYPAVTTDPTKALAPDAGAADWKAYFDQSHARDAQLIAAAPTELTASLTSLQTANDRLAAVYAEAEYDPKQIDTGLITQLMHDAGFGPAVDTVARYAKNTCRLD